MQRGMCLFAHFDRNNRVAPYVTRYVKAIAAIGFKVVFISTNALDEAELAPLREVCSDIILRENVGHDFGSWAAGFCHHGSTMDGELLLANDSVYGPIGDLGAAVDRLRGLNAGMAGFVESAAHVPHLQSWFLLIKPEVYRSVPFQNVLLQDLGGRTKREIVEAGELGLSLAVRGMGARVAGLFSDVNFVFTGHPFNPTMLLWRELIEETGCPFVKVELLRDNPCKIPGLENWRKVVAKRAPELTGMIQEHLARITGRPEAKIAKTTFLPSLFHYWGWYRRAFYLRSSLPLLRRANALLFEQFWKVQPMLPRVRHMCLRLKNMGLRIKHRVLPIDQLGPRLRRKTLRMIGVQANPSATAVMSQR